MKGESGVVHVEQDFEFCPKCGVRFWHTLATSIDIYDEISRTILGYRVFFDEHENYLFIASDFTEVDNLTYSRGRMMGMRKAETILLAHLKPQLQSHGLWNENEAGIWVFLSSC